MKKIPVFKPDITSKEINEVTKVLRSGWLGAGPKVEEFEKAFAEFIGTRYAAATNSCTASLHLALVGLGVNSGEVLVPSLGFISTSMVPLYVGARPVFVDVNEDTLTMSPSDIERKITNKTKAIILMHYAGQPCELDEILAIARKKHIHIIEDASHACGSAYKGKKTGSFGDVGCFSFHAVKNLTTGDGGMLTFSSARLNQHIKRLRWLGIDEDTFSRYKNNHYNWQYTIKEIGFKYQMNDIAASIGLIQLKRLEPLNAARRKIAAKYDFALAGQGWIKIPAKNPFALSSCHMYVIRTKMRDSLGAYLARYGISTGVHYFPNNMYPLF